MKYESLDKCTVWNKKLQFTDTDNIGKGRDGQPRVRCMQCQHKCFVDVKPCE